jgi:hypothetical protein
MTDEENYQQAHKKIYEPLDRDQVWSINLKLFRLTWQKLKSSRTTLLGKLDSTRHYLS